MAIECRSRSPARAWRRAILVFGDADGVVGGAARDRRTKVIAAALAKVAGENATREALARGEKLADVFKRHGIL